MNTENFKRFLELQGRRVIASESGYWYDAGGGIYLSIPYTRTITPEPTEMARLFRRHRMLGVKYSTADRTRGRPGAIYLVRDRAYGLHSLKSSARGSVQKGLARCTVREVDFDYLHQHGPRLNRDTLARQARDDRFFSDPARWARLCWAGQQTEGASAWGAFVGEELAAYMICFLIDGCCNVLHEMSRTDLREYFANNALQYSVILQMIGRSGVHCVSAGLEPIIEIPGLDRFKRYAGYEKVPCNYVVTLHPLASSLLLSRPMWGLLCAARRRFPQHDVLKRVHSIVDMARLSQSPRALESCENPTAETSEVQNG